MDLGYARVSTTKQDLDRQVDALTAAGVAAERIWLDKKSGVTTDRPGLTALLAFARPGDVIVVHTLDRLGRTVRDTLNLIHDLTDRGVGLRNLADPIKVDTANPADPMGQLAVVLLALFAQMERTYTVERAAHARAVATANGRRVGRPTVVDPDKLAYAAHLRDRGARIAEIVTKTGITRASLYRHLPPRTPQPLTAAVAPEQTAIALPEPGSQPAEQGPELPVVPKVHLIGRTARHGGDPLEAITWPTGYSPTCSACAHPTTGLEEQYARVRGLREPVVVALAQPCGCLIDDHAAALQAGAATT
ncbi:Site-specific DNA recombinase [Modestobacter sp. DSM 44400]|uniref:recombinase family protein n=1 Tax=Modestobacter sp. DSM 44400 TaxID=1550230 RepID=UPI0008950C59|nr:recombinase family protein [Modestobacter sp. DSM 44400]SDY87594.1 Site-specific DNA recombinase [Modestobacter sp. DSM 44400]